MTLAQIREVPGEPWGICVQIVSRKQGHGAFAPGGVRLDPRAAPAHDSGGLLTGLVNDFYIGR